MISLMFQVSKAVLIKSNFTLIITNYSHYFLSLFLTFFVSAIVSNFILHTQLICINICSYFYYFTDIESHFLNVLKTMMHPDPSLRPTSTTIVKICQIRSFMDNRTPPSNTEQVRKLHTKFLHYIYFLLFIYYQLNFHNSQHIV